MTNTTTLFNEIKNALEDMQEWELLSVHNEYCDAVNYTDDCIYSMDDFDDLFCGCKPSEIAQQLSDSDFNYFDDYFKFTVYGVESLSYISGEIDIDEIAEYIADNWNALYNDTLQEIIDELEEVTNNE